MAVATVIITGVVKVPTARASSGTELELGPAPIAQSKAGAPGLTPGTATFVPATPGAPVSIQRKLPDGSWMKELSGKQDADGHFSFVVQAADEDTAYTFRAVTAAGGTLDMTPEARSSNWDTTWSDEFNGTADDGTFANRPNGHAGSMTCSAVDPGMLTRTGTALQLQVAPDPAGVPAGCALDTGMLNAAVGTQPTQSFTYGIFAARIKYASAQGVHGAFWMQPQHPGGTGDPAQNGAEIDISEYFGDGRADGGLQNQVWWSEPDASGTPQLAGSGLLSAATKKIIGDDDAPSDGYHVYSVEWTPTEYIFRLDGVETFRTSVGVSQQPEYLILSLLSSDWELPKLNQKKHPTPTMSVDWVRVWQQ